LDRLDGLVEDVTLPVGETTKFGKMNVTLSDCRYPQDNPAGNAYTYLTVQIEGAEDAAFDGWMVASSPALNALDDPRYDVWPLACKTS